MEVSRIVRDAFFRMFSDRVGALRAELRASAFTKLEQAQARLKAATSPRARMEAQKSVWNAQAKATESSIERSTFSHCIFELEDAVLACIATHFEQAGWTVASLIFDGLHVEHRDGSLVDAVRGAEARVACELGYEIRLEEKPLHWLTFNDADTTEAQMEGSLSATADAEDMEVMG